MAGIYIHIPFCKQRCTYCNFHFSTSLSLKEELLSALHKELELQQHFLDGASIETLYFGGGTPSLLSADEINYLFQTIQNYFPIDTLREFTLEANPDDLSTSYLKSLRQTPINRLSIGVQSFQDEDLKFMNRAHNKQQADYAIKAAQDNGYSNLTIDLIYGSPLLSDADWLTNLNKVKELDIPHFSSYALTVEEGTLLHLNIREKKTAPLDIEKAAHHFELLMGKAEDMGFEHYEISNFAKKDCYAIHNTNYWSCTAYLGIGPSAHSFANNKRRWNISNNALYIKSLMQEGKINFEEEILSKNDRINEYIMTSLRTQWGCDLNKIENEFGNEIKQAILKTTEQIPSEHLFLATDNTLTLTNQGKLFADKISASLFV